MNDQILIYPSDGSFWMTFVQHLIKNKIHTLSEITLKNFL